MTQKDTAHTVCAEVRGNGAVSPVPWMRCLLCRSAECSCCEWLAIGRPSGGRNKRHKISHGSSAQSNSCFLEMVNQHDQVLATAASHKKTRLCPIHYQIDPLSCREKRASPVLTLDLWGIYLFCCVSSRPDVRRAG